MFQRTIAIVIVALFLFAAVNRTAHAGDGGRNPTHEHHKKKLLKKDKHDDKKDEKTEKKDKKKKRHHHRRHVSGIH